MTVMSESPTSVDVAVVGVGRMGRLHARAYQKLAGANLVAVVDPDADRAAAVADELDCEAYDSVQQLLERHHKLSAVSVAVPTVHHVEVAGLLIERGIACLVEKPLAPTAKQAKALSQLATRHGVALQVGHTERFNPAVRAVASLRLKPRFMEVQRISPMTFRSLDISVVMDLMIHDLDIVLMLAGSPLAQVEAVGVAVLGTHEDVANARLTFASGCVANLTASRLAFKTERKLRVFSEDAYVSLDYARRAGVVIRKSANADVLGQVRQQLADGADLADVDYSQLVQVDELAMGRKRADAGDWGDCGISEEDRIDEPLPAQLSDFLTTVRQGGKPLVDADAGFAAVEAAERVLEAIHAHRWEGLASSPV